MIRILIVEDSALQRNLLKLLLESDPEIHVVGMAINGAEGAQMAAALKPDLITMDIRMPVLNGFEATRRIMQENPTPIVVVSASVDAPDLAITFNAIKAGALDVIEKPQTPDAENFDAIRRRLIAAVKGMSLIKVKRANAPPATPVGMLPSLRRHARQSPQVIVIGASTGGPLALAALFKALPRNFSLPLVVIQHMAIGFHDGFAQWLQTESALPIRVVKASQTINPGTIYLATDDCHLVFTERGVLDISHAPPVSFVRPSATVLFNTVAQFYGAEAVGVIMTGMGSDGAKGLQAMHQQGAVTLAQDEATCTVFGMPKAAIDLGAADQVLRLEDIAPALIAVTRA